MQQQDIKNQPKRYRLQGCLDRDNYPCEEIPVSYPCTLELSACLAQFLFRAPQRSGRRPS